MAYAGTRSQSTRFPEHGSMHLVLELVVDLIGASFPRYFSLETNPEMKRIDKDAN